MIYFVQQTINSITYHFQCNKIGIMPENYVLRLHASIYRQSH